MEAAFRDWPLGIATLPPFGDPSWSEHSELFADPLDAVLNAASFVPEPPHKIDEILELFRRLNALQRAQVCEGLRRAAELADAALTSQSDPLTKETVEVPTDVKVRFQRREYASEESEPYYPGAPIERFVYTKQHRSGRFTVQFSS
ncbi:MAG: hypothetical protein ACKVT1_13755 [Dehalococcoidia bacterium]